MPLFEVAPGVLALRRLKAGAELCEREIDDLLWRNPEEFTGDTLFPVARQTKLPSGGIPDIIAQQKSSRAVVLEVKRDVECRCLPDA